MFVVRRRNWRRGVDGWVCIPGDTAVGSFATFDAAEADRRTRERDARTKVNPFECGPLADIMHLPEPVFRDWLQDAGIDPPADDWANWWKEHEGELSDEQRERVWAAADKLRFFDVAERPNVPVVYGIVQVNWQYNDQWYYADSEAGRVTEAYRSRERAERACREANSNARMQWEDHFRAVASLSGEERDGDPRQFDLREPGDPFDPERRPWWLSSSALLHLNDVPFYKVVEVDVGDSP